MPISQKPPICSFCVHEPVCSIKPQVTCPSFLRQSKTATSTPNAPALSKFHRGLISFCAFVVASDIADGLLSYFMTERAIVLAVACIPGMIFYWYVDSLLRKSCPSRPSNHTVT